MVIWQIAEDRNEGRDLNSRWGQNGPQIPRLSAMNVARPDRVQRLCQDRNAAISLQLALFPVISHLTHQRAGIKVFNEVKTFKGVTPRR